MRKDPSREWGEWQYLKVRVLLSGALSKETTYFWIDVETPKQIKLNFDLDVNYTLLIQAYGLKTFKI